MRTGYSVWKRPFWTMILPGLTAVGWMLACLPPHTLGAQASPDLANRGHSILDQNCSRPAAIRNPARSRGVNTTKRATLITTGVLVPGSAANSRLIQVIESGEMPLGGKKLAAEDIQALKAWVDAGASDWNAPKVAARARGAPPNCPSSCPRTSSRRQTRPGRPALLPRSAASPSPRKRPSTPSWPICSPPMSAPGPTCATIAWRTSTTTPTSPTPTCSSIAMCSSG